MLPRRHSSLGHRQCVLTLHQSNQVRRSVGSAQLVSGSLFLSKDNECALCTSRSIRRCAACSRSCRGYDPVATPPRFHPIGAETRRAWLLSTQRTDRVCLWRCVSVARGTEHASRELVNGSQLAAGQMCSNRMPMRWARAHVKHIRS